MNVPFKFTSVLPLIRKDEMFFLVSIRLNCDLGEGHAAVDRQVMPLIHMANIACGGHAGDAESMDETVGLAVQHEVSVGAHPGYPDREGFGRISMKMSTQALAITLHDQISTFADICKRHDQRVDYVKPHGALYNDMMKDKSIFDCILNTIKSVLPSSQLVLQATARNSYYQERARIGGISVLFEAFSDRAYLSDGSLAPRTMKHAVYSDLDHVIRQVRSLCDRKCIRSIDGDEIAVEADTLCVHGDSPLALESIPMIRSIIDGHA